MNNLPFISLLKCVSSTFIIVIFSLNSFSQCLNNPGTINKITKFMGQSSRHDLKDTVFLCWQDRFYLDHNNDFNLSSDPNPSTKAAIGYAWYKTKPVVSGDNQSAIKEDEIFTFPNDSNIVITVDKPNGDAMFENRFFEESTAFNKAINPEGKPSLIYYAPITVDRKIGKRGYFENDSSCVRVNIDEAFPVVYLNPIQISGIHYNKDNDSPVLSFIVKGGLPEFYLYNKNRKINYTNISISSNKHSSSDFIFLSQNTGHGDTVMVQLPDFGTYRLEVSEGISCAAIKMLNINKAINPVLVLDTISGKKGENICINFSVKEFKDIELIFGRIDYNPGIVEFIDLIPVFPDYYNFNLEHPGLIRIDWAPRNNNFEDGTKLFQLCFKIIGNIGECSPVILNKFQGADKNIEDVFPSYEQGLICIEPPDGLFVSTTYCGSKSDVPESSINFKIYNGLAPYSYNILNDTTIIDSGIVDKDNTEKQITDLYPGTYTIKVDDSFGETIDTTVFIAPTPLLQFEKINIYDPCFDMDNGKIVAKIKDDSLHSYDLEWSTNEFNTDSILNLTEGMYFITVEDNFSGCKTDTAIFLKSKIFSIEDIIVTDASCFGSCDGKAEAVVNKNYDFPLIYKWNTGNTETISNKIENLCFGHYILKVFSDDRNLCKVSKAFTINQPDEKSITVDSIIDVDSLGSFTGAIYVSVPSEGYSFQWQGPNNFTSYYEDIDNLEAGCYTLTAEDTVSGCYIDTTICVKFINLTPETKFNNAINIYPNPANEELKIDFHDSDIENFKITILDMSGKIIRTFEYAGSKKYYSINLSKINPGLYLIKLQSGNNAIIYKKIVINRMN